MECRAAPLLFLLPLLISSLNTATLSSLPPSPSPSSTPTPNHTTPSSSFALDPKQLSAVRSLGLPTITDPCSGPDAACDSASPFRHVTSLLLADCPTDLSLLPLRALSGSLQSLALLRCPAAPPPPRRFPLSLQSFSCSASLRRLSGVWLSRLRSLTHLSVSDVPITATGPWVVLSHMPRLQYFALSRANLSGEIPRHWHALNLSHIDLSSNRLKGPVPESIAVLSSLEFLNLSSNSLTGALPDSIGDLGSLKNASFSNNSISGAIPSSVLAMSALVHLDLSSNRFNDSIPRFLSEMKGLRYLNLEDNNFHGVVPFNESFIKGMEVFRVGGNGDLCYNRTLLSSKLKLGIAPCDKYGLPVSPPAAKPGRSDDSEDDGDDEGDGQREGSSKGGSGHRGPSKVVLGVGIGLACLVFLVVFLVCISKLCS